MKMILKYCVDSDGKILKIPKNANILSVQVQRERIQMWAMVDTEAPLIDVMIRIFGTGISFPPDANLHYIGTVQLNGFVWHIFIDYMNPPAIGGDSDK